MDEEVKLGSVDAADDQRGAGGQDGTAVYS